MIKIKILTTLFIIIALGMAGFLGYRIYQRIDEEKNIARVENKIKDKLIMIRSAQEAYRSVKNDYAERWEDLIKFIETGKLYIVEKTEIVHPLEYGQDSIEVIYDTLGAKTVKDSLFPKEKYPNFDSRTLSKIPENPQDLNFVLYAGKVQAGNTTVDVVEVKDTIPFDKRRREDHDKFVRRPLRFGSRDKATLSGNWE